MRKFLPKKRRVEKTGLPRFIYLLVFLAFSSWIGWAYLLLKIPPAKTITKISFLGFLFFALFFTFTFLFYETGQLLRPGGLPHEVLRTGGRRAFFLALFFSLTGALALLEAASPLNVGLFGLILALIEIQLSRGNRRPPA